MGCYECSQLLFDFEMAYDMLVNFDEMDWEDALKGFRQETNKETLKKKLLLAAMFAEGETKETVEGMLRVLELRDKVITFPATFNCNQCGGTGRTHYGGSFGGPIHFQSCWNCEGGKVLIEDQEQWDLLTEGDKMMFIIGGQI